ncbi:hypothetical protein K469DRAFT_702486 [Zopfia rhizophila CBS 207.26]|uniref:Uncharacterized protein n=1 Tax=Zopfia rhizophila CBS 207.26 TaxID=1314779 RepID=A0A6A6EDA9_9PEZI|nr:hypothetical protein K469DRAFT_702486 [Zopfia rhizophila CBS 207.26]
MSARSFNNGSEDLIYVLVTTALQDTTLSNVVVVERGNEVEDEQNRIVELLISHDDYYKLLQEQKAVMRRRDFTNSELCFLLVLDDLHLEHVSDNWDEENVEALREEFKKQYLTTWSDRAGMNKADTSNARVSIMEHVGKYSGIMFWGVVGVSALFWTRHQ